MIIASLIALAAMSQSAPANAEPVAKPVKEKKMCRREGSTTTRIPPKTICRTQAEWDAIADQTGDMMRMKGQSTTR